MNIIKEISPNNAEEGSLVRAAEKWLLSQGFMVPTKQQYPHLFQGMLEDFSESEEGRNF